MCSARLVATAVLVTIVAYADLAHAAAEQDAHALLRRGIAFQREANWSNSIASLERARAAGVLAPAERIECAFYLGAAYVAIGSDAAARRELAAVLDAQPSFEPPPFTSPKVASMLGEVARERTQRPELESRPPHRVAASGADLAPGFELGFAARRAHAPYYGVVRYRMRGETSFREVAITTRDAAQGVLVAVVRPSRGGVLEYYADALSATGPLHAGSADEPLELPVAAADVAGAATAAKRGTSKLVWLAVPLGVVVGVGLGLGLYYGLPRR